MKLVVTIDTEEDNWGDYSPSGGSLENINRVPPIQDLFNEYGIIPTYLVTYPVATCERSISILKRILEKGRCEIGMHCHPWNTPPCEEATNNKNSMLANLPAGLQYRKMKTLQSCINANFGIDPKTFRAGRWSCNEDVLRNLHKLGGQVDTSITPFLSWAEYGGSDYSHIFPRPFKFTLEDAAGKGAGADLIEIPATVGFLQENFSLCSTISDFIDSRCPRRLRLRGILSRLHLLKKVALSPELCSSEDMIKLTKVMTKQGYEIINMAFHSTSLIAGLGPFTKAESDEKRFFQRLRQFLSFVRSADIEPIKLSDTGRLLSWRNCEKKAPSDVF